MKLLEKQWNYINEGNVHVVLQLLDTDNVVRLVKEDGNTTDFAHMKTSVDFVNKVMNPILGNNYNLEEEIVELPVEILQELSRLLLVLRPQHRRFKSVFSPYAIIAQNLAIVSSKCKTNYCVEIKPKEGFMSKSLQTCSKCYFCLKQYTKLQMKQIETISNYCPLDLFSGIRMRMKHALKSLVNNPQNNFKLFQDGSLLYHETSNRESFDAIMKSTMIFNNTDNFFDFVIDILLGNNKLTLLHEDKDRPQEKCDESSNLATTSFLYRLLQIQRQVETIDIIDVIETSLDYVPIVLNKLECQKLNLYKENDQEIFFKTLEPLHVALISAVAKDCSIMISFSRDLDENYPSIEINNKRIAYKVSITDLEPKSFKSVLKRMDNEKEMIEFYQKYVGNNSNTTTHRN